jgi:hypothetical protein
MLGRICQELLAICKKKDKKKGKRNKKGEKGKEQENEELKKNT